MKKTCLLTLTIGASLAFTAFAATKTKTPVAPPEGTNFVLNAVITNNPAPVVATINGVPQFEDFGSNSQYGVVYTDGSGKIDGVEDMIFTNLDLCEFTSGDFVTQIGGSISTVGGTKKTAASTVVQMTMKGNGYVQNSLGSSQAQANVNLTFKGTLFASNSMVNLTTTNTFLEIGTNYGETVGFTNIYTYSPVTNFYQTNIASYQELYVYYTYESSFVTSNSAAGTNTVLIQNKLCQDYYSVRFGTPTGTTNLGELVTVCTNVFTNVVIGTNIEYSTTGTNVNFADTNLIYGLNISTLPNYIAAVSNCVTVNTNGNVAFISYILTNTVAGGAGSSTNTTLYAQIFPDSYNGTNWIFETNAVNLSFSNGFFEVDGVLKGQISAGGKCKQSFNGTNASFTLPFTDYATMTGSGANTNGPYFGTNRPYLATNDSGIYYVVYEYVPSANLGIAPFATGGKFNATVKQFGNNIWISSQGGFFGSGAQNPKKGTYKVNLSGIGRLSGSSLVITGATGTNIVGFNILTNVVAVTNTAANPPVVGYVTNITAYTNNTYYFVPGQVIAGVFVGDDNYDYFSLATNGAGTANITVTNSSICSFYYIPPTVVTNTVECIRTVFGTGKVLGQKVSGSGTNEDIAYPNPALPSTD